MTNYNLRSPLEVQKKKKRGRPPRNPIEYLRTRVFMFEVCRIARVEFKGYQLEKYFEPEKISKKADGTVKRPCKWDRFVSGAKSPSPDTLKLIFKKSPNNTFLKELYYSPIWTALAAGNHDDNYWLTFYKSLRFNIQKVLFNSKSNIPYQRNTLQNKSIDVIFRQWDFQALACLIALTRDKKFSLTFPEYDNAEVAIYHLLLHSCSYSCFIEFVDEIWNYMKQHIINRQRNFIFHKDLWDDNVETTMKYIVGLSSNIYLAEDLDLISPGKLTSEFMFWKHKGNTKLIIEEMLEARQVEKYKLKDSHRGLKWLVGKLNQSLPKSRKIEGYI